MSTDLDLIDDLAAAVRAESQRTLTGPDMPWIRDRAARHRRRRARVQGLVAVIVIAAVTAGGMWVVSRPGGETVVAADEARTADSDGLGRNGPVDHTPLPATTTTTVTADGVTPCDRTAVVEGLDAGFVVTDEQEITRLEELSGRYSGRPGARAVVRTTDGRIRFVVDDEAAAELVTEAESSGMQVVTSCVTAADLRAVDSILAIATVDGDDFIMSGYSVFTDMVTLSTSLPEAQIRAALEQAGIPAERIDSVVTIDSGQPGQVGRLIGGTDGS